jgi:hypothetical protein
MICAPDSTHRPCDCGADSPNCEVCDEQWPCAASAEAAIARVRKLHKPKQHPDGMTVCAHDDYDWPCPTYNIVATERTPEDDNR